MDFERASFNGIYKPEETEKHTYTPNRLFLSLSNLPNLAQIIKNHRANQLNNSFIPQIAVISNNGSRISESGDSDTGNLQSYLALAGIDLGHKFPITVDLSIENDQFNEFMDALIRSLIELYPNLLIQFEYSSDHAFDGLYFTANSDAAKQLLEFFKAECKMPEKKANALIWLIIKKDLVTRDFGGQFTSREVYFSYGESEYESKSFNEALDYVENNSIIPPSAYITLETSLETSNENHVESTYSICPVWSVTDFKNFKSNLSITTYSKGGKEFEIIRRVRVQVSIEERKMILGYLRSYVIANDATAICSSQDINGFFTLHNLILEHLKIQSSVEAIKGLTFYVGSESLKRCDISIWQTVFVMIYLERVLAVHQSEWETAYKKAYHRISEQLKESHYKELYFACEEYLIQKGIEIYNDLSSKIIVNFDVDDKTRYAIGQMLVSAANEGDSNDLCNALLRDGSFNCHELHELTSGSFKIQLDDEAIGSLKNFVEKSCLRRLDKNVWVSSLIIVYFELVFAKYMSKWNSVCDNAKIWISQRVCNPELEKELYDACSKYLIKRGYDYLLNNYNSELEKELHVACGYDYLINGY